MGTGASKGQTAVGVPVNPRVKYSKQLGKKEKKQVIVDAPVLVDVEHGSVRYRQANSKPVERQLKGKECPFETEKNKGLLGKEHYFYHARLNEYGPDSSKEKEDAFKFYYVTKGPISAHKKKIFYVYGQGWNAKDGLMVKPTETVGEGKDYAWSSSRQPNSLYYTLQFNNEVPSTEEDKLLADLESSPDKSLIKLSVNTEERTAAVKARVAVKLLKRVKDIHIAFDNKELRDEDFIGDLRPKPDSEEPLPNDFSITLLLV